MALSAASATAFVHGSGVPVATLQLTVVSAIAVGALLWLAWTALALWRDWHDWSLCLMDMQWGLMRTKPVQSLSKGLSGIRAGRSAAPKTAGHGPENISRLPGFAIGPDQIQRRLRRIAEDES